MRRKPVGSEPQWTQRDEMLWTTAEIGLLLAQGRLADRPSLGVPFVLSLGGNSEAVYAYASFVLHSFAAPGDGSYLHATGQVYATGRGAVPLMLGSALAQSMANAARRRAAAALAQPRWMPADRGTVSVGSHGFYLHTAQGLYPWSWEGISMAVLVGPGRVQLVGEASTGQVNWILESDLAELVFLLWATVRNPGHEQLANRLWLPREWLAKARRHAGAQGGREANFTTLSLGLELPPG